MARKKSQKRKIGKRERELFEKEKQIFKDEIKETARSTTKKIKPIMYVLMGAGILAFTWDPAKQAAKKAAELWNSAAQALKTSAYAAFYYVKMLKKSPLLLTYLKRAILNRPIEKLHATFEISPTLLTLTVNGEQITTLDLGPQKAPGRTQVKPDETTTDLLESEFPGVLYHVNLDQSFADPGYPQIYAMLHLVNVMREEVIITTDVKGVFMRFSQQYGIKMVPWSYNIRCKDGGNLLTTAQIVGTLRWMNLQGIECPYNALNDETYKAEALDVFQQRMRKV